MTDSAPRTELVHVLFIDIIGYSTLSTSAQGRAIRELNRVVGDSPTFRLANEAGSITALPTGDGMALLFRDDVTAPAECAVEVSQAVRTDLPLRMGVHSGVVQQQIDISGKPNVAGEGINIAQRVMDLCDEGHILVSEQYAGWLNQFPKWRSALNHAGAGTAKHGLVLKVWNLATPDFGNCAMPSRVKRKTLGIAIIGSRSDGAVLQALERSLSQDGHRILTEAERKLGPAWARSFEERIGSSEVAIVVVSTEALESEMFELEFATVQEYQRTQGSPRIICLRIGGAKVPEGTDVIDWTGEVEGLSRLRAVL